MSQHDERTPAHHETHSPDPVADPGLPPHKWRPTDVDPKAEKRAERQVALFYAVAMLLSVLFVVCYLVFKVGGDDPDTILGFGASTLTMGLTLGGALLCIGIGTIQLARKLMADEEIVEMRHPAASSAEDRETALTALRQGGEESGLGRRKLVTFSMAGAMGALLLPGVVLLRDLGPLPGDKLYHTVWGRKKHMRVVRDVAGTPIKPEDLQIGDLVNAEPEILYETDEHGEPKMEGTELQVAEAKAAVIVVRMAPEDVTAAPGREKWGVDGILCYSKICTHVGCPISLYEQQTHHVLCPCHQSTFDLSDNAKVVFGPAARPLPQLPLTVDSEGYLAAQRDFDEPVGPSFWERG